MNATLSTAVAVALAFLFSYFAPESAKAITVDGTQYIRASYDYSGASSFGPVTIAHIEIGGTSIVAGGLVVNLFDSSNNGIGTTTVASSGVGPWTATIDLASPLSDPIGYFTIRGLVGKPATQTSADITYFDNYFCSAINCMNRESLSLSTESLRATPIPATLPLFLGGLTLLALVEYAARTKARWRTSSITTSVPI